MTLTVVILAPGVPTLGVGLICVAIARATGGVTVLRLTASAAIAGALVAVAVVVPSALSLGVSFPLLAIAAAAVCLPAVLAAASGVVAGFPLHDGSQRTGRRSVAEKVLLGAVAVAAVATVGWLGSLYAWGTAHPCTSCG